MIIETHTFKQTFVSGKTSGYLLSVDLPDSVPPEPPPFLTRKYDNHHLCVIVFENRDDAENEKKIFPTTVKISVKEVSHLEIQNFLSLTNRAATLVFLRAKDGAFAML